MVTLTGLYIYPIKSAAGIALPAAAITGRGFQYDRRWMVVDANGDFITQRTCPQLALVSVAIQSDSLVLSAPDQGHQAVPLTPPDTAPVTAQVWGDRCEAVPVSSAVDQWLSAVLGQACRLVYMPDTCDRPVDHGNVSIPGGAARPQVSFADAYPFLLISEASLADLNRRLPEPVLMNRFRPNLVVAGCDAFAEDSWSQIRVGAVEFHVAKPCSRCTVTTVDQATGQRGAEPLRTLATFRRWDGKIWFGQNLIQQGSGTVRISDSVTL